MIALAGAATVSDKRRANIPNLMSTRNYAGATGWHNDSISPHLQNMAFGFDAMGNASERSDVMTQ